MFLILQVKNLSLQLDQEKNKRAVTKNELNAQSLEADNLKGSEKQLKQEINSLLESKRSLEFQLGQLSKYLFAWDITINFIYLWHMGNISKTSTFN